MNEDLLRLLQDVTDPQTRQAATDLFNSVSQGGRNVEQALLAVRRTYVDIVAQSKCDATLGLTPFYLNGPRIWVGDEGRLRHRQIVAHEKVTDRGNRALAISVPSGFKC